MSPFSDDELHAAPADIDYQNGLVRMGPAGLHTQMDQPRLFRAGDDFNGSTENVGCTAYEVGLVAGITHGAGGYGAHAHDFQFAVSIHHSLQHLTNELDGFFRDETLLENTGSQASHFTIGGKLTRRHAGDHLGRLHAD